VVGSATYLSGSCVSKTKLGSSTTT
jgi:hypothetical protein